MVFLDDEQLLAELVSAVSKQTPELSLFTTVILTSSGLTDTAVGL